MLSPRRRVESLTLARRFTAGLSHEDSVRWWLLNACFLAALVITMIFCLGLFEVVRFSTFILKADCAVVSHEVMDLGMCTACKGNSCRVFPMAAAKIVVTFKPLHSKENVTSTAWHCKPPLGFDPCFRIPAGPGWAVQDNSGSNQLRRWAAWQPSWIQDVPWSSTGFGTSANSRTESEMLEGQKHCDLGDVHHRTQATLQDGVSDCYYNSRDPGGHEVWFEMPQIAEAGSAAALQKNGVPLMCVFIGVVLFLTVLFGFLALVQT